MLFSCKGDFGKSYSLKISVIDKIKQAFFPTLNLSLLALFFMLLISVPAGIFAAVKVNKWQDYLVRSLTFIGISVPSFG